MYVGLMCSAALDFMLPITWNIQPQSSKAVQVYKVDHSFFLFKLYINPEKMMLELFDS